MPKYNVYEKFSILKVSVLRIQTSGVLRLTRYECLGRYNISLTYVFCNHRTTSNPDSRNSRCTSFVVGEDEFSETLNDDVPPGSLSLLQEFFGDGRNVNSHRPYGSSVETCTD